MSKKLIYGTIGSFESMAFSWVAYVLTTFHMELESKRKMDKFVWFFYFNYLCKLIVHTLSKPIQIDEPRCLKSMPQPIEGQTSQPIVHMEVIIQ